MVFLVHLFSAIAFFIIVNQLGKQSIKFGYFHLSFDSEYDDRSPFFNILFKSFTPVLLTYILAYIFNYYSLDYLNKNIYVVVIYYFIFRFIFILLIGRVRLTNWYKLIVIALLSLAMIYIVYTQLIVSTTYLLPTKQEIATAMWLGIVAFIYKVLNEASFLRENTGPKIEPYLKSHYFYFKYKYGYIIDSEVRNEVESALVYSVLIFENFNRGRLFRAFEKILFFTGKIKTTGIMQVQSNHYLSDTESVMLGTQKLLNKYRSELSEHVTDDEMHNQYSVLRNTIIDYNPDDYYYEQIDGIIGDHPRFCVTAL
ncbi:hypothetical protein [Psychrobacter submarinus]|uniref:hypothetical protein n=1 Tax=Psychrobacter submarinus TaxID=154108 RepID=UPI00191AF1F7|nr:hypothetical protein [Psychrobacter submarinus]